MQNRSAMFECLKKDVNRVQMFSNLQLFVMYCHNVYDLVDFFDGWASLNENLNSSSSSETNDWSGELGFINIAMITRVNQI